MRHLNEIIVHCSATRRDWWINKPVKAIVGEFRRWHKARGWSDIGYHEVIDQHGNWAAGRPIEKAGAHVKGRNRNSIGICLVGGHGSNATDDPLEHFTRAQLDTLRARIAFYRHRYPSIKIVSGHNEYAAKACPGFYVPAWYDEEPVRPDVEPAPPKTPKPKTPAGLVAAIIAALAALGAYIGGLFQ